MGRLKYLKKETNEVVSRVRDKRGRWKKGVSGNKLGRAEKIKGNLAETIAQLVSHKRIAKTLINSAYSGDERSILKVIEITERVGATEVPTDTTDFNCLTVPQLSLLECFVARIRGQSVADGELLDHARKVVAELAPPRMEEESAEEDSEESESESLSEVAERAQAPFEPPPVISQDDPDLKSTQNRTRKEKEQRDFRKLYGEDADDLGVVSLRSKSLHSELN